MFWLWNSWSLGIIKLTVKIYCNSILFSRTKRKGPKGQYTMFRISLSFWPFSNNSRLFQDLWRLTKTDEEVQRYRRLPRTNPKISSSFLSLYSILLYFANSNCFRKRNPCYNNNRVFFLITTLTKGSGALAARLDPRLPKVSQNTDGRTKESIRAFTAPFEHRLKVQEWFYYRFLKSR